jgi:hypothetical protein
MKEKKREKKEKREKREKKINKINNHFLRKITKSIYSIFNLNKENAQAVYRGIFYKIFHMILICLNIFIILFSMNLYHLMVGIFILTVDALSVVILHGCPLTFLEKKCLENNVFEDRNNFIQSLNIGYECTHEYEQTIDFLIHSMCLVIFKCVFIIFFKTFHFKLNDLERIYV